MAGEAKSFEIGLTKRAQFGHSGYRTKQCSGVKECVRVLPSFIRVGYSQSLFYAILL